MKTTTAPALILTHTQQASAIQRIVCDHYGVTIKEILGDGRPAHVVRPRQVAMSITRELLGLSTPRLAVVFNRDAHGTILHACNGICNAKCDNRRFWDEYEALKAACCTALGIPPDVKKWRAES